MKIAAYKHTELLKDPSKPFRIELPATAVFRTALMAAGQPSLMVDAVGANVLWPVVIMAFDYQPDKVERDVRWYQCVAGPVDFIDDHGKDIPVTFLCSMWEQRPDPHNPRMLAPWPVLLYEVHAVKGPTPVIFQKWRRDLSKADIQSQEKPVFALPVVVGEWFDVNREYNRDAMSHDIAKANFASLEARVKASGWDPDWCTVLMHGWSVRISRYLRGTREINLVVHPQPHLLLMIARGPTAPRAHDWTMRENIVERLGGDILDDFLMNTGPDDAPDLITFWTWPQ